MPNISMSLFVIDDTNMAIEVQDYVSLKRTLELLSENQNPPTSLSDANYTFFIAKPIIILSQEMLQKTLAELNVSNGSALIMVRKELGASKIRFFMRDERSDTQKEVFVISRDDWVIGRNPDDQELLAYRLDTDLSEKLQNIISKEQSTTISRRQAIFTIQNNEWYLQLHERANASMFLNNEQVNPDKKYLLQDEMVLTIGTLSDGIHLTMQISNN